MDPKLNIKRNRILVKEILLQILCSFISSPHELANVQSLRLLIQLSMLPLITVVNLILNFNHNIFYEIFNFGNK